MQWICITYQASSNNSRRLFYYYAYCLLNRACTPSSWLDDPSCCGMLELAFCQGALAAGGLISYFPFHVRRHRSSRGRVKLSSDTLNFSFLRPLRELKRLDKYWRVKWAKWRHSTIDGLWWGTRVPDGAFFGFMESQKCFFKYLLKGPQVIKIC